MTPDFFATVEALFHDWRYDHPKAIYGILRSLKPNVCVEVGSYRGYAACYMARALQENQRGHLYCIDNFSLTDHTARYGDPEAHWRANLEACGVSDCVTLLRGNSDEVEWPERVDFCYIDGWHSYEACMKDFATAQNRGASVIAFDDTTMSVGPRMVLDFVRKSGDWDVCEIDRDCGLGLCFRRAPKGKITFSQELPYPNPGVDLRPLTLKERAEHFGEAAKVTGLNYSGIIDEIGDMP